MSRVFQIVLLMGVQLVAEEQPIGSIVGKITATDPDSPIDRYEFLPPHPFFDIDGRSGVLNC
jgi:hypothetical protein